MTPFKTTVFLLAMILAVYGSPVLQEEQVSKDIKEEVAPLAYTVPNSTWNYSTVEEILAEIAANKAEQNTKTGHIVHKRYKCKECTYTITCLGPFHLQLLFFFLSRALGCASTVVAYGSNTGAAFTDFATTHPWPCGVDIVQIRIREGGLIDAIQLRYRTVDGVYIQGARRGGEEALNMS